jgi:MYXO-CTERM domain-containing protein
VKTTTADSVNWNNIQVPTSTGLANIRFSLSYRVVDLDGVGTTRGQVISVLTATNTGTTAVTNVNLFNYVDYFFTGEDSGDQVLAGDLGVDASGNRYIKVSDTGDTGGFGTLYHQGIGANAVTAGSFGLVGGQMTDTNTDNFGDFNGALTAGDQTGVMQWTFASLGAGETATAVSVITIPTPGAFALVGLGGLVAARRRRA